MEPHHHSSDYPRSANANDLDGILWTMSSKLARAQLARQISSSSSLRWQQQARIHKPASTGNSPQNASRKRMAAHQPRVAPHHHSEIMPQMPRRRAITTATNDPSAESRPTTWHPLTTSATGLGPYNRHSMYDASQHALDYRQLGTHDHGTLASQPEQLVGRRDRYYSVPSQPHFNSGYIHVPVSSDWAIEPSISPPSAMSSTSTFNGVSQPAQAPGSPYLTHQHEQWTASAYMAPPRINPAPTKLQANSASEFQPSQQQMLSSAAVEEGPELIGMGLYDPPEKPSLLFEQSVPLSSGRGLKLEDAWIPPEDEDGSDDGQGDDDDQEDEESVQQDDEMDSALERGIVPKVYGADDLLPLDMSNKSFFFEDGPTALQHLTMADWHSHSNGCDSGKLGWPLNAI